jgi:hypothetical protein
MKSANQTDVRINPYLRKQRPLLSGSLWKPTIGLEVPTVAKETTVKLDTSPQIEKSKINSATWQYSTFTMRFLTVALLALTLDAGVDAFVPHASVVARDVARRATSIPDGDFDAELRQLEWRRNELGNLKTEITVTESEFNSFSQNVIADLADSELVKEKLRRELEAAETRRKQLELQLEASKTKQQIGRQQLENSMKERDMTRNEIRDIKGGSGLFPLASLSVGAIALGRSALEQRRQKVEGKEGQTECHLC